jgi:hypothetical protein
MCALTMCFTTLSKSGFHLVVLPTWLSSWKWETSWIISDTRYWYFDGRCVAGALNSKAIRTTTRLVLSKAGGNCVIFSCFLVLWRASNPIISIPPKKKLMLTPSRRTAQLAERGERHSGSARRELVSFSTVGSCRQSASFGFYYIYRIDGVTHRHEINYYLELWFFDWLCAKMPRRWHLFLLWFACHIRNYKLMRIYFLISFFSISFSLSERQIVNVTTNWVIPTEVTWS